MSLVQVHSLRHSQWAGSPGESSAEALGYDLVFPWNQVPSPGPAVASPRGSPTLTDLSLYQQLLLTVGLWLPQ